MQEIKADEILNKKFGPRLQNYKKSLPPCISIDDSIVIFGSFIMDEQLQNVKQKKQVYFKQNTEYVTIFRDEKITDFRFRIGTDGLILIKKTYPISSLQKK